MSSPAVDDLVPLDTGSDPDGRLIGGKALSLVRMIRAGLPVPPGAVLTTAFFAPWLQQIRESPHWRALGEGGKDTAGAWVALQAFARALSYDEAQQRVLAALAKQSAAWGDGAALAVRSSSPHEDLETASFAGIYQSFLHVRPDEVPDAVRRCFVSGLDARVDAYKTAHGLDAGDVSIAVIVQAQVSSDVAGVAFSLNPMTNDHDEVLVAAAPGLGHHVVDGTVDADQYLVNALNGTLLASRRGGETGQSEREPCLDRRMLASLTRLVGRVEVLFGCPVDVEWAVADRRLHLLQTRPITRYFPIPDGLATAPGARRRLFTDTGIDQGLTLNAPVSAMGMDMMSHGVTSVLGVRFGFDRPPGESVVSFAGQRPYMDLSALLYLLKPQRLAEGTGSGLTNTLLGEILRDVDREAYRAPRFPGAMVRAALTMAAGAVGLVARVPLALAAPGRFAMIYDRNNVMLERAYNEDVDYDQRLATFMSHYGAVLSKVVRQSTFPALGLLLLRGTAAVQRLMKRASDEDRVLLGSLLIGLHGDPVMEMDLAIWRAASRLPASEYDDLPALAERVQRRTAPEAFLVAWDELLHRFGHRGPGEMDVRNPRFGDDPQMLLSYMASMVRAGAHLDPVAGFARQTAARQAALAELMERSSWWRRRRLRRVARITERFASARNLPKHQILQYLGLVRRRLLTEGSRLTAEGALDAPEDVFDLTLTDLEGGGAGPGLRAERDRNRRRRRFLEARVRQFPLVVDSRGRILRPRPVPSRPGELQGHGVSPGRARGRVRVLDRADAAGIEPGDVIIAYVTDPGWTPLFVNAAAIVLEIGGAIQHGVLVARELGRPCVVGISRLTERLKDGDQVEVDGDRGIVTVLNGKAE